MVLEGKAVDIFVFGFPILFLCGLVIWAAKVLYSATYDDPEKSNIEYWQ